jgi:large conductance mechanosensitive channel
MTENTKEDKLALKQRFQKVKKIKDEVKSELAKEDSFVGEFKEFAFKGNIIDLAIGIIIGGAFNNLVQSFVKDIIMPPIGKLIGNVNFSDLYFNLAGESYNSLAAAEAAGAPIIRYGRFFSTFMDFLILSLTVFIVLRYLFKYRVGEKKN